MEQGAGTNPERHKDVCTHTFPAGRKLLFRGPRAGIFQGTRGGSGNLTYLHSNLFAYKHKTTFVSQKARRSRAHNGHGIC